MRVLYVEDNELNQKLMEKLLGRLGCEVLIASEGSEALQTAMQKRPSFIIMDYHLPGMDGIEATQAIKANPVLATTPIVALTADLYTRDAFLKAGCESFMTKPISKEKIEHVLHQMQQIAV
jgi:CheY-like chemotaxis protein